MIFFFFSIILDSDSTSIVQKVSLRNDDLNLGEQTMAQVCKQGLSPLEQHLCLLVLA